MKRNYIYILFILIALSSNSIYAQELNKDVKVVREYNPIISDAFKINKLPVDEVDSTTFNPSFSYDILSKAMASGLAIEPITAARLKPERKTVLDKSYVKGALGNYATLFGDLNYNVLRSEEYALGLNIGHLTSNGDIELEDKTKSEAPIHDTWASLYFRRFWDKYTLSLDAEFDHNIYDYYGYQTMDETLDYYYDPFNTTTGDNLMADRKQRLSSFGLNMGFGNKVVDPDEVSFKANLKWQTFSNITGVSENGIGLNGKARVYFDNMFLDIVGGFDYYGTSVPDSDSPLYNFMENNTTVLNISPAVGFVFEGIDFKVGLDSYSLLGGEGDGFNIAPHVDANLVIAEGIVSAFAGVQGDYEINNYQKIQKENRFVAPDVNVLNSFNGLHFFGGLKGNFSSQTSFVARVDYSIFDNEHFYVNHSFSKVSDGTINQTNLFDVVYDDGNLLTLSGELKYEPSQRMNILLKGKYNGYDLDNLEKAWHKPEVEIGLTGNYEPFEDLWVNLGVYSMGKRYALDVESGEAKELKSVIDINLGAEYMISSKWTMFAQLNNAIVSKYYQWNGYPMQGLNIRVGVGYSF